SAGLLGCHVVIPYPWREPPPWPSPQGGGWLRRVWRDGATEWRSPSPKGEGWEAVRIASPPAPPGRRSLLDVAGAGHVAGGRVLRLGQGIIGAHLAGESGGEELADIGGDAGEFGDGHELHAGIGHRIDRRLRGIGGIDRVERHLRKGRCRLVLGILV